MIRICFSSHHVGNRVIGEKPPLEDKSETHGLCDDCLKIELEKIESLLKPKNTQKDQS